MPSPLALSEERGGNAVWVCPDCGRWEYQSNGRNIRHSSRCDCPEVQPPAAEPEPAAAATEETSAQRRARIRRGDWDTAAEVHNDFGNGDLAGRILLDTDY